MATIIDYADVLKQAERLGLKCVYYNTGAFGFPAGETVHIVGWLGPADSTIRPGLLEQAVYVPPPYPASLAAKLLTVWPSLIDGDAWLLPKSHWAFELDHGNGPWLVPGLTAVGIDAEQLRTRTDGSVIAFSPGEVGLSDLVELLLGHLKVSDFAVLFPHHRHLLTLHHHQQLWWQTTDADFAARLRL